MQENVNNSNDEKLIAALVTKHKAQIDYVLARSPEDQKQEFISRGIAPQHLQDYYDELARKSVALREDEKKANDKSFVTGWLAFGATAMVGSWLAVKRKIHPSHFYQIPAVVIGSGIAGFIGNYLGWRQFGGNDVRKESKVLVAQTRKALEQELAVAFENAEQQAMAKPAAAKEPAQGEEALQNFAGQAAPRKAPEPRASFREEALRTPEQTALSH